VTGRKSSSRWALTEAARFDAFTPAQLFTYLRSIPERERPMLTRQGVNYLLRKWYAEGLLEFTGSNHKPDYRWADETPPATPRRPCPKPIPQAPRPPKHPRPHLVPQPPPAPIVEAPPPPFPRLQFSQVFVVEKGSPYLRKRCGGCGGVVHEGDPARLVYDGVSDEPRSVVHNLCAERRRA
jgi:hypothetical protein